MSGLNFNIRGQVFTAKEAPKALASTAPKVKKEAAKRVKDRDSASISCGFLVLGYSPDQMAKAKQDHESARLDQEKLMASGEVIAAKSVLAPWFADAYMNSAKPKRVRSKPYELHSAAEQCKELAEKAGWLRVRVEEILKA